MNVYTGLTKDGLNCVIMAECLRDAKDVTDSCEESLKLFGTVEEWEASRKTEPMSDITNGDIMKIMLDQARDWSKGRSKKELAAVSDYLNCLCYYWMGGDWGLKPKDLKGER